MREPAAIGGYFELALPERAFPHNDGLLLNNGRACMTVVLEALAARHVYVPKYTCDVVLEPMRRLGIGYSFLAVNDALELDSPPSPGEGEMVVVNNYFGLQDDHCRALSEMWGERLIVDCSQAWYAPPLEGSHCFYTPRKFFGVPDGGCLHSPAVREVDADEDLSHDRVSHLLKRLELGAEAGFPDFQRNDSSLTDQPVRRMSRLTRSLLGLVDHEAAKRRRAENFATLDGALAATNRFRWKAAECAGAMVYPYRPEGGSAALRRRLIENKVFVATYWPNVLRWSAPGETEHGLATDILPLPIDQRYGPQDMARILEVLL